MYQFVCDRNAMYDAGKEDYLRPSQHIALCTIVAHNIAQNRLIEYGFDVPLNTADCFDVHLVCSAFALIVLVADPHRSYDTSDTTVLFPHIISRAASPE